MRALPSALRTLWSMHTALVQPPVLMVSQADYESNQRLVNALFESTETALEKDPSIASHLQLDLDEDGKPTQLRFAYVHEEDCIGCTYCSSVARNTFFMEDSAGRARAYAQGADDPEVLMEAIDSCPVNCISFVDHEDLVILETERDGITIGHGTIGYLHGDNFAANRRTETKAKLGGAMCCNNCPSRGCTNCPMYGVGLNPMYQQRVAEREAKKSETGEAAQEQADRLAAEKIDTLFEECVVEETPPFLAQSVECLDDVGFTLDGNGEPATDTSREMSVWNALYGSPEDDLDGV